MAQKKKELSEFDKSLIFTPGRGRNTWTVYFWGEDDGGVPIRFVYRLNISSLPFGLRYLKMYDSVFVSVPEEGDMIFSRDYAEMRKKKMLSFDELFFEGQLSKIQGSTDLIDLESYISGAFADVAMDHADGVRFISKVPSGSLHLKHENVLDELVMPRMDCQGLAGIRGKDHNVKGISWVDKKYVEFPKGRIPKPSANTLKINLLPEDSDQAMTIFSILDRNDGRREDELVLLTPGEDAEVFRGEELSLETDRTWVSEHTDIDYPVGWNLRVPELDLDIKISSDRDDQEVYSVSGRDRVGEYIGLGTFTGKSGGETFEGLCSIETFICD